MQVFTPCFRLMKKQLTKIRTLKKHRCWTMFDKSSRLGWYPPNQHSYPSRFGCWTNWQPDHADIRCLQASPNALCRCRHFLQIAWNIFKSVRPEGRPTVLYDWDTYRDSWKTTIKGNISDHIPWNTICVFLTTRRWMVFFSFIIARVWDGFLIYHNSMLEESIDFTSVFQQIDFVHMTTAFQTLWSLSLSR